MIEILFLIFLSRNIGSIAYEKGHSPGIYRILTFVSWIVFEIIGAIIGSLIFGEGIIIYVVALASAGFGYFVIYMVVNGLTENPDFHFAYYIINSPVQVYERITTSSAMKHELNPGDVIKIDTHSDLGKFYQVQLSPTEKGYILKTSNIRKHTINKK